MAVGSKGLAGVHKRSEELASQRQAFGLRKFTTEFRWDGSKPPGENVLNLRILGDDIVINTQMHRAVPLPDNKFFFGVCRKAYPIGADSCYVCDVKAKEFVGDNKTKKRLGLIPADVAVALAVEQELVPGGFKAKLVEFEIPQITDAEKSGEASEENKAYRAMLNKLGTPGSKVAIPNIGLMIGTISGKQALFDYATKKETISDRVFAISRYGAGLETAWLWDHEGAKEETKDPAPILAEYLDKYPFDLPEEWAIRSGAESRYNHFFQIQGTGSDSVAATPAAAAAEEVVQPVSNSRDDLMKRLKGTV